MTFTRNGRGAITAPTPRATRQPATLAPMTSPSAIPRRSAQRRNHNGRKLLRFGAGEQQGQGKGAHAQAHGRHAKMFGEGLGAPDDEGNAGEKGENPDNDHLRVT